MPRTLRPLVATAVLTLVAGLFGIGVASADEPEPDPMAGAPAVGACYDLTLKQAYEHATAEAPVECTARHTMVVTAIGEIPASIDWAGFDWEKKFPVALARAINTTCDPAAAKLLGPDRVRALTLYQDYWFAPAEAAVTAGARWFSCLVSLTTSTSLLPIPAGQPAKLAAGSIPDTVAQCAKRTKGGYQSVACSRAHQWRTTYTKLVNGKLTDKRLLKAARRTCPRHVSSPEWLYFGRYVSRTSYVVGCSDKTRR